MLHLHHSSFGLDQQQMMPT